MKKVIISILAIVLVTSCRKDLTSLNVDPKNPVSVPSSSLFTSGQLTFARTVTSPNVNLNIFRLIVQHWTQTTYTDETNFDIETRNIPQNLWTTMYRDVIRDLREAKETIPNDVQDATIQKNQIAVADMLEVYAWYYLVSTYGNIPYSEALNIENIRPKYDDAKTIYTDLIRRLNEDINNLNTSAGSFGSADIIYNGNTSKWKMFGNSLKLKMGMLIADSDPAMAKTIVESAAAGGTFTSNADNAQFYFLSGPPNTNPVWEDLVQSGRKDFVVSSTLVNRMQALDDPRVALYFTRDANGGFSGGLQGPSNNYATFSKPSERITAPNFPGMLLSYSEIEFYKAEAIERGFNVGGTAMGHYNNAITASILYWGGTTAQATAYLAQPNVNYLTAPGNYKRKIGEQLWIALFNRGWDAWINWRRLDFPQLTAPTTARTAIPLRFTYPVNEQNLNRANYEAAAGAIGGDVVTTKLWWDRF